MPTLRTDRNQTFNRQGQVVAEQVVTVDVTAETVDNDLRTKARQALQSNATYLALGNPTAAQTTTQVQLLTRQVNALIRLVVAGDLLADNTDT